MAELEPEKKEEPRQVPKGAVAAAGVAAVLGALAFSRVRRHARVQAHQRALAELAEECGCELITAHEDHPRGPDFPSLCGKHRGRQVQIRTDISSGRLGHRLFTTATAAHSAPVQGFAVVRRETLLSRVADHLGLCDVQVGEAEFDSRFEVASDQPDATRLLQPEVRDVLMAAQFESVVIRGDEVAVRQDGPVPALDAMRQSLKLAIDIAEWLETLG